MSLTTKKPKQQVSQAPRLDIAVIGLLTLLLAFTWQPGTTYAKGFVQSYTRGKILLRQKLYRDAARAFKQAISTPTGQRHFGARYFLGVAQYRLIQIDKAVATLNTTLALSKNPTQKRAATTMLRQIKQLFGKLQITPKVDPDEVGRLRLQLETKAAFSHAQKRRVYRILKKRWATQGITLNKTSYYLPRGSYTFTISMTQCLQYGFAKGNALQRSLEIGTTATSLSLISKQSCQCEGGQVPKRVKKQFTCVCPKNTAWSDKFKRCQIPKSQRSWIGKHWPWVTAIGVGVVGGGIALTYFLATNSQDQGIPVTGKLFP